MVVKPTRADAVRNRSNIVRAARTLIAASGVDVGMDEIAREAGVAVGTLYRHFPAKADLVTAIIGDRVSEMTAELDAALARLTAGGSARDELVGVVTRVADAAAGDRLLKAAAGDLARAPLSAVERHARDALAAIVAAGHHQGSLYPDITADDVALVLTLLPGDDVPEPSRRRWLELTLRSLVRPGPETAAPPAGSAGHGPPAGS